MDSNDGFLNIVHKMSAIKKFFDEDRARKQRIREMRKAKVQPVEPVYVVDQAKLDRAYNDIMNWNMNYPEDLMWYYESLDQEEYEYILQRSAEFPPDVQQTLWGLPVFKIGWSSKLKVVDFTDKMYLSEKAKEQQEFEQRVEAEMAKRPIPPRPSDVLDESLAEFRAQLKDQEEQLEKLMKGPTKKYVAPSMRKQTMLADPEVQKMQAKIDKTKNEICVYEKYIVEADNGWKRLKQLELRDQVSKEMLEL
jgi:hypothetical protein